MRRRVSAARLAAGPSARLAAGPTARLAAVLAAGALLVTGCGNLEVGEEPATTTSATTASREPGPAETDAPPAPVVPCVEQHDYAGDPRPPEELDRIRDETGQCPAPEPAPEAADPGADAPEGGTPEGAPGEGGAPPAPAGPVPPPGLPGDPGFNGEVACNDAVWRRHMQAEGDTICGSTAWADGFFG